MPYRFALGARPFVDEMNILQTAALFSYPFVKVFVWLRGATGIVLFMRHLYLLWSVLVAAVAFTGLRRVVRWEHALLASLAVRHAGDRPIGDLSYNTLGAGLLVIAMGLGARALVGGGGDRCLAAAGVAQALAALAYPTLVLARAGGRRLPVRRGRGPPRAGRVAAFAAGAGATLVAEAAAAGELRRGQRAALRALPALRLATSQRRLGARPSCGPWSTAWSGTSASIR